MNRLLTSIIALLGFTGAQASDFPPNVEANQKVIKALVEAGSDSAKPHPLEHHFYCHSPDSLKMLIEKGESLGYRVANTGDNTHESQHYWFGDLIKDTVLDLSVINKENSIMLALAHEFNADYDGWGTPVVE